MSLPLAVRNPPARKSSSHRGDGDRKLLLKMLDLIQQRFYRRLRIPVVALDDICRNIHDLFVDFGTHVPDLLFQSHLLVDVKDD